MKKTNIDTPFGEKELIYADCTGSGASDPELDRFVSTRIMPYYANIHSDSFCSDLMTAFVKTARAIVKRACVDTSEYALIFSGNGMTGAARHFAFFMSSNVTAVLYTSLEHVSNSTLWEACFPTARVYMSKTREHDPSVIDIDNMKDVLLQIIRTSLKKGIVLIAFTACSNVLGRVQPVEKITRLLDRYRELAYQKGLVLISIVDCAACAPYIPLDNLCKGNDAIVFSPHKFKGGQSTPGVLKIRKVFLTNKVPFFSGWWYSLV